MVQNAELHPLKTWKIENGDINLFCEQETLRINFKSTYKVEEIALKHIQGIPDEALQRKKWTVEIVSRLFEKMYPKVVELEDGTHSLQLIHNCFEGMKISVKSSNQPMILRVNPNDTVSEVEEKIRQKAGIPLEETILLICNNESLESKATLASYGKRIPSLWRRRKIS